MRYADLWFLMLILCLTLVGQASGQISKGGEPWSGTSQLKSAENLPLIELPFPEDIDLMADAENLSRQAPYAVAIGHEVDINVTEQGRWETIPGKGRICRLRIRSADATAIHLFFEEYALPEGAELFIYNTGMSRVLGAYTSSNNKPSGKLTIQPVPGDEVTIEYFEPEEAAFSPTLRISNVGHNYRENILHDAPGYGDSERCNKDINCSQAAEWQTEKRAVCKILYKKSSGNWFICTGALINTTRNDGSPYFLTANHCVSSSTEAESMILYFNYESPTCNGPDGDDTQTLSGSSILATTYRLDFSLVELSETPPLSYLPYYAGWDASEEPSDMVVSIHHPKGDVKKFSQYNKSVVTGDFTYLYDYDDSTHWYLDDWSLGITEGGSSGSPLFNSDHRIVGDLTGGSAVSNCTSSDAYYAKIYHSWADYPNSTTQLKYWLDPDSTGQIFIDGYDPLVSSINANATDPIHFEIFPNPARDKVFISTVNPSLKRYSVEILELSGKVLYRRVIENEGKAVSIPLSSRWNGFYLLRLIHEDVSQTEKLIIL